MDFLAGGPLTGSSEAEIDGAAAMQTPAGLAAELQGWLGQKAAAEMLGLSDVKQLGRYQRAGGPTPRPAVELRMRESYKLVRMITTSFDIDVAKSWLSGTNSQLGDHSPAVAIREAKSVEQFARLRATAREFILSQATVRDPMADMEAVRAARAKPMAERLELALSWNLMASELRAGIREEGRIADVGPV